MTEPVEIVIRLQLELPPGMTLAPVADAAGPLVYRIPAAAEKLGISPTKVAELIARGEIDSLKLDGSRRIPAEALKAYLARIGGNGDAPSAA